MLKRIVMVMAIIALLGSVGSIAVWGGQMARPAAAQAEDQATGRDPAQTITVVGQGTVSVSPDIARVSIGVETSAETVGEAVADNTAQMKAILAALKEAGIADKDIRTMNYSVHMDRYPEPVSRVPSVEGEESSPQYRVSNMANVTMRDLDRVGEVLDGAIEAGANSIWGLAFELDDGAEVDADARSKAVEDARARAQALAELNEVQLGPVMSVSEVVGSGVLTGMMTPIKVVGGGGGPVRAGELEVSYQVQVSYFIAES